MDRVNQEINNLINTSFSVSAGEEEKEVNYEGLVREFAEILPLDGDSQRRLRIILAEKTEKEVCDHSESLVANSYQELTKKLGEKRMIEAGKLVILGTIDRLWVDHLDQMEGLREGVSLRSYGQQDPLSIYQNEAFEQFEQLMSQVDYQVSRRIFRIQFVDQANLPGQRKMTTNIDLSDGMGLVNKNKKSQSGQKPGRNGPCPCGSGEKYKKCCYPKYG